MTTQEHIDGLIATIWNATENRSVTNVMVARVLDWLNRRALQLEIDIEAGHHECRNELEAVRRQIKTLSDTVKGVNTLASNAYGRADTNARAIEKANAYIFAILKYLESGEWPEGWEGGVDIWTVVDRDRGKWKEGETYYNGIPSECNGVLERSHVWYFGCKYVCLVAFTHNPPAWNSSDWEFEEGDPDLRLRWIGAEDSVFVDDPKISLEISATLYNQDLTEVPRIIYDWTRESFRNGVRDTASDALWNDAHKNAGPSLLLDAADMNFQFGAPPEKLTLTVTATLHDPSNPNLQPQSAQFFMI